MRNKILAALFTAALLGGGVAAAVPAVAASPVAGHVVGPTYYHE